MILFRCYFLAVCLALAGTMVAADMGTSQGVNVPTFSVLDLLSGFRKEDFAQALRTTGLLAIRTEDLISRERALEGMCSCIDHLGMVPGVDTATVTLDDESTIRTTFATATAGSTPLPLPKDLASVCGPDTAESMDRLRDEVATVADVFVVALDRLLAQAGRSAETALLRNIHGGKYTSISDIRESANHLEHFHVYTKETTTSRHHHDSSDNKGELEENDALDWHTDAGLFLAFVPALDCHQPSKPDDSFYLGGGIPAVFPSDSVVIMLGEGARSWLNTPLPLHATRHAVKMHMGERRAWYGMMFLVPESAIVQTLPSPRTFRQMREVMVVPAHQPSRVYGEMIMRGGRDDARPGTVSIGCGLAYDDDHDMTLRQVDLLSSTSLSRKRSRLQQVQGAGACNNSTNFFCWMSCRSVPDYENAKDYIDHGDSLYCLDPSVLASTGQNVSQAAQACVGVHNPLCVGSWQPTVPGVPATLVIVNSTTGGSASSTPFCYGGTSMYMDGFHWRDTACIIYLSSEWVLSSTGKVAGASLGTALFGMILERVMVERRRIMAILSPGYLRLALSAFFYGLQLTMGYLLMLVVMTYSGPLFMSVILGLTCGHILFSAQDAIFRNAKTDLAGAKEDGRTTEVETGEHSPTNSVVNAKAETTAAAGSCQNMEIEIPEGSTPCCQNML